MKYIVTIVISLAAIVGTVVGIGGAAAGDAVKALPADAGLQRSDIYIRTEVYPRPPYSGATYYIYERGGEVICTKLEVCNKFNDCTSQYKKGVFKEDEDVETGDAYDKTDLVLIPSSKLRKHTCLTKFKLLP